MFNFLFKQNNNLADSTLYSEKTFYKQFLSDLSNCKERVIIESPYITMSRMEMIFPHLQKLVKKNIEVQIITRDPIDHDEVIKYQATEEILRCVSSGINVKLIQGNFHRKIAITDDILWEGSLNILSQAYSKEIMRRSVGGDQVSKMLNFINVKA